MTKILAKGNYWNSETQKAIEAYINEPDAKKRSLLYVKHIHFKLEAMASSILKRYHLRGKTMEQDEIDNLVNDAISHTVQNAFNCYDPATGNSFSYFQTVIRNYYRDIERPQGSHSDLKFEYKSGKITSIEDSLHEAERLYNYTIDDEEQSVDELRIEAARRIKELIYSDTTTDEDTEVLQVVLNLLRYTGYNRYFSTWFISTNVQMGLHTLSNILKKFNLSYLIYYNGLFHKRGNNFSSIPLEYADRSGGDVVKAFNLYAEDKEKERQRKLAKNKAKRHEAKRKAKEVQ